MKPLKAAATEWQCQKCNKYFLSKKDAENCYDGIE